MSKFDTLVAGAVDLDAKSTSISSFTVKLLAFSLPGTPKTFSNDRRFSRLMASRLGDVAAREYLQVFSDIRLTTIVLLGGNLPGRYGNERPTINTGGGSRFSR